MEMTIEKAGIAKHLFQPILVSWYIPNYEQEVKVVCHSQSQLDFFRETLHVKHWEQRIYSIELE